MVELLHQALKPSKAFQKSREPLYYSYRQCCTSSAAEVIDYYVDHQAEQFR